MGRLTGFEFDTGLYGVVGSEAGKSFMLTNCSLLTDPGGNDGEQKTILAVDRNARNLELMQAFLEKNGYHVETAATLEAMDRALLGRRTIHLALIDIAGFDRGIWERCERIRDARIPFPGDFPPAASGDCRKRAWNMARTAP